MYVKPNIVMRSRSYSCRGKKQKCFMCVVELHFTVSCIIILNIAQHCLYVNNETCVGLHAKCSIWQLIRMFLCSWSSSDVHFNWIDRSDIIRCAVSQLLYVLPHILRDQTELIIKQQTVNIVCVCAYFSYPTFKSQCFCAAVYRHLWPDRLYRVFPQYSINGTILGKSFLNIKFAFWFSVHFCRKYFSFRL